MTHPYDPNQDNSEDHAFNPYPPSQHPEDRPDFAKNPYGQQGRSLPQYGDYSSSTAESYPQNGGHNTRGYGAYPASSSFDEYGVNSADIHPTTGWPMHQGEPTGVPIGTAISYGFKETFKNGRFWIIGSAVFLIASTLISLVEDQLSQAIGAGASLGIFSSLFSLAVGVCAYRLAFNALDGKRLNISDTIKGYSFLRAVCVAILAGFLSVIAILPGVALFFGAVSDLLSAADTLAVNADPNYVISLVNWGGFFGGMILMLLGAALIAPFVSFIQLFPIDRNTSVGESFSYGFKVVGANYLPLLGYFIAVMAICLFGIFMTLGLGMVILLPFLVNASSYVFRSIIGGVRPVAG